MASHSLISDSRSCPRQRWRGSIETRRYGLKALKSRCPRQRWRGSIETPGIPTRAGYSCHVHVRDGVAPLRRHIHTLIVLIDRCPRQRWRGSIETVATIRVAIRTQCPRQRWRGSIETWVEGHIWTTNSCPRQRWRGSIETKINHRTPSYVFMSTSEMAWLH